MEMEDNVVETFQVDVAQLTWIINNFYSHKEVFLRELISNSIDALDKVSCDPYINIYNRRELCIKIILNKNNRTLTIFDNGIGMSKTEMIRNFGVITKSFMTKFMSRKFIGQFGIGFYSVYLVADKVTVTSKCHNDNQYLWESSSNQFFSIRCDRNESLGRGTKIVLHIKNDHSEYLEESNIRKIIEKYFQFSKYPINVLMQEEYEKKLNEDKAKEQEEMKKKMKARFIDTNYAEYNLDKIEPIFTKSINNITGEEYKEFYKLLSNDWQTVESLGIMHFSVENPLTFEALLYIPIGMFEPKKDTKKKNEIKLYVKRVFIMDNCEELIPSYLNFVKGIVYSKDLPLSISRERVQSSKILNFIRNSIVMNCLDLFNDMTKNKNYNKFFKNYGKNIKLGIYEDSVNYNRLTRLLRYHTSASGNEACSLKDYVGRMKKDQKYIYFITGESIKQIKNSVFLEAFKMHDIEVIYMTDPIDEFIMEKIKSFNKIPLISVARDNLMLPGDDNFKKMYSDKFNKCKNLFESIRVILKDTVQNIGISNRLIKSPCCIEFSRNGWTANMEKIAKAQILYNPKKYLMSKKQFKINLDHDIFQNLLTVNNDNLNDENIKNIIILLYETALISSGFTLERPDLYAAIIYLMIQNRLGI